MRKRMEQKSEPWGLVKHAAIGSLLALGVTLALLFAAALLTAAGRLPEGLMGAVTAAVLFLGSLVGALFAIRRNRRQALLVGLAQGGILYAVTIIGGAFSDGAELFGSLSLFLLFAALGGGALAGFFAARPKKKKL